jgi:hypothetical protein
MNAAVPNSRQDFPARGPEAAECAICKQAFDANRMSFQIRECGHQFVRVCIEEWLRQSDNKASRPTCRGVLFEKPKASVIVDEDNIGNPASIALRLVRQEYFRGNILRLLDVSDPDGFLARLWWSRRICGLVLYLAYGLGLPDGHRDRATLSQEMRYYRSHNVSVLSANPAVQLGPPYSENLSRNIIKIARLSPSRMQPDPIFWRALILFQTVDQGRVTAMTVCNDNDHDLTREAPPCRVLSNNMG